MSVRLRLFEPIPADMPIGRTVRHNTLIGVTDEVLETYNDLARALEAIREKLTA